MPGKGVKDSLYNVLAFKASLLCDVFVTFLALQGLQDLKNLLEKCSIHITVVTKTDDAPE